MKYLRRFLPLYVFTAVFVIAAAVTTSRAVTAMAENEPVPRAITLVIDAGHGGIDGGATSCTGVLESHINLEIALRLQDLSYLLGYRTVMIRSSDISVYTEGNSIAAKKASDLRQRVRIVNETEGAILISIHQNIFADGRYKGAQVFYAATPGSQTLANQIQSSFTTTVNPGSNRQEKPAHNIFLLQHIRAPGVLVECGFLSNPEEEALLRSKDYQNQICCVILCALSQYLHT